LEEKRSGTILESGRGDDRMVPEKYQKLLIDERLSIQWSIF
jgi:hypothetical protein